jgi:hypothetical protein
MLRSDRGVDQPASADTATPPPCGHIPYGVGNGGNKVAGKKRAAPPVIRYRRVTSQLDPVEAPALEPATVYRERWEIEATFDALFNESTKASHARVRTRGLSCTGNLLLMRLTQPLSGVFPPSARPIESAAV